MAVDGEPEHAQERVSGLRRALWEKHVGLPAGELDADALDAEGDTIETIFELTDELLAVEEAAARRRSGAEHARSSRVVYAAAGALGVGSALLFVLGLAAGWYSGWGLLVLAANVVVAIGMIGVHAISEPAGHRERLVSALVALGLGVLLAVLGLWWLPWWVAIAALVGMLVNGMFFAAELLDQR